MTSPVWRAVNFYSPIASDVPITSPIWSFRLWRHKKAVSTSYLFCPSPFTPFNGAKVYEGMWTSIKKIGSCHISEYRECRKCYCWPILSFVLLSSSKLLFLFEHWFSLINIKTFIFYWPVVTFFVFKLWLVFPNGTFSSQLLPLTKAKTVSSPKYDTYLTGIAHSLWVIE